MENPVQYGSFFLAGVGRYKAVIAEGVDAQPQENGQHITAISSQLLPLTPLILLVGSLTVLW